MNRIFHSRITWYHTFLLVLLGALTFYFLWEMTILLALCCALLLVFLIERLIHTTYTITTDGNLILSTGRFLKPKVIPIKDIVSVEKRSTIKLGSFYAADYLLIHYGKEKYVSVLPIKEREFMGALEKQIRKLYGEETLNQLR